MKNPLTNRRTLLIWDSEGTPPGGDWITVLWRSFGEGDDPHVISIPRLVEDHADNLRSRYLAWIYELGETRLKGRRLVDHLELRPGFSYWWMTSLAQKFNTSGTSQIDNAIKAFALEGLISERRSISIVLVSGDDKLAATLHSFCKKNGVRFKWNHAKPTGKPKPSARQLLSCLPTLMSGLIYFFWYVLKSLPLMFTNKATAPALTGEIVFVDVLVHLDRQAFTTGTFISNYWTSLVDKLFRSGVETNWLHNYFHHESISSLVQAQGLIGCFNKSSGGIQSHVLIESNLSLSLCIKALKDYFRLSVDSFYLSSARRHFLPAGSALDLWPLFKHEWIDSLRGQSAMLCCLRISLYEKIFSGISYQKIGVYIQENQPWEMALLYAWKAAGHGKLIGVPHTAVRFWDLRYFYDSRSYEHTGKNILPTPDLVAVNGPVAKKAYLAGRYPETRITEVEALRFFHLLNRTPANAPIKSPSKALKVLVCGDFLSATNYKILSWLAIAAQSLPPETSYVLKPHPAYSIKLSDYKSLPLKMTNAPLTELFADCDVVFTSNITSAAVDAYCMGIPVVQMLDGTSFNMSPLRDLNVVMYVTNPMELAEALRNARHRERLADGLYFWLDEELPRWRQLLGLSPEDASSSVATRTNAEIC